MSARPPNPRKSTNIFKLSKSPILGRLAIFNYFNSTVDALAPTTRFPRASAFLPNNLWPWVWSYLKYILTPRVAFPTYAGSSKNGVYQVGPLTDPNSIRLAIAGDWGTGTEEAWQVADLMEGTNPDFTIHLGDVYYVGNGQEVEENCLGKKVNGYDGVYWPHGKQGSFALNGNHEMLANGGPYFHVFLPTLGMTGDSEGQVASFFCLETRDWRIIAIDTGYNSVGMPVLGTIPWLSQFPLIGADCYLEPELLAWLQNVVQTKTNPKPTILLSHHHYFSAFPYEQSYPRPARQLAEFFTGQEVVWIWGHEHRLGIYDKHTTPEGLTFYGRCAGHGGMPIEMADPDVSKAPLLLYDQRTHPLNDKIEVGQNGFLIANIAGTTLTLDYRDVDNNQVLFETFTPDPVNKGRLILSSTDPGILSKAS